MNSGAANSPCSQWTVGSQVKREGEEEEEKKVREREL